MSPQVKIIRVLMVGASGSGKSTFINVAGGRRTVTHAVDSDPAPCGITVLTIIIDGTTYKIELIDTPGIGDAGKDGKRLTDQEIRHEIGSYLQENGVMEVHAVFWMNNASKATEAMTLEAAFYIALLRGQLSNTVIIGQLPHVRKQDTVEGSKDSALAVTERFARDGQAQSAPAMGRSLNVDTELSDDETCVSADTDDIMRTNGHQQDDFLRFIVEVTKGMPAINILEDMGVCEGCLATGDLRYSDVGMCHYCIFWKHDKSREERVHNGTLTMSHRPTKSAEEGRGEKVAKAAFTAIPFVAGLNPWVKLGFASFGVLGHFIPSGTNECGCGQKDGCEGVWSCCKTTVDGKMSRHDRQVAGASSCPDAETKLICTNHKCGKVWVAGETVPDGCIAICTGPDGRDEHTMFDKETGEVHNQCVNIKQGGKHLGQRKFEAEHA